MQDLRTEYGNGSEIKKFKKAEIKSLVPAIIFSLTLVKDTVFINYLYNNESSLRFITRVNT